MAKVKVIKQPTGTDAQGNPTGWEKVYPITSTTAVIGTDGKSLEQTINDKIMAESAKSEATRQQSYEAKESQRDAIFAGKEQTRDAANQAALNAAGTLAEHGEKLSELETQLPSISKRVGLCEDNIDGITKDIETMIPMLVDSIYTESFNSGSKDITCGFAPKDIVVLSVKNKGNASGYFTIGVIGTDGNKSEITTQIMAKDETLVLNRTEVYSGKGYYCNNINSQLCDFVVKKQNRKITNLQSSNTSLLSRVEDVEDSIKEIEDGTKIEVKSTTSSTQTLNVSAEVGAYLLKIVSSNNTYGSFDFLNDSSKSLANDLLGNDANEKKTIPNRLFTKNVVFEKRVYFSSKCTSISLTNPNGVIFTITLERLKGSNEYDIVVAADGTGHLTDLYDAIKWIGDSREVHKTIFVKPGTYIMPELNFNSNVYRNYRNLSIIGTDKNSVIIQNTNGAYSVARYDNAPIQMSGNVTLKNLTIISTGENYDRESGKPSAYCVHADFAAHEGDVFEIDNCELYDDHYAALAMCPNKGQTIRIKNCHAKSLGMSQMTDSWQGVLISHDNNNGDGIGSGKIECISNILESDGNGMAITSNYFHIDFLSIGCAWLYGAGKIAKTFNGDVLLDSKSCLNNVIL